MFRLRTISLWSFAGISILLIASYVTYAPVSKADAQLRPFPQEVKCPESLSDARNKSRITTQGGRIFFLETSERTIPNFQAMCAVESAAITHPNTKVTVFMKGLSSQTLPLPRNLGFSFLSCFPNVEFAPLNFKELFANTPLSGWYTAVEKNEQFSDFPIDSDACRLAILWKSGGIYLDTDFIILKNLENLTNMIGMQSLYTLNGAFLAFEARHRFIKLCMEDFVNRYNYWFYGHQGPQLLTRVYKWWCLIHRLRDRKECRGVSILPKEAFYPVDWQDWRKLFETISRKDLKVLLMNTYGLHLWNKKSQGGQHKEGSMIDQLEAEFCPETYKLMKMCL
ncbi:lactosylceramide 4-alpha-galactosyltransferase [Pelobates cultripes]|uniref:Lactosylceramide 4-alpha-galactosyltransferase n=1 Tax=Pelobates cultripes TaxID=61616 RepID=A0AAD1RVY9_PELCU|nr:lactosylceramide 4-alpha-galactosyltransferase [Pelobates cultripes]